MGRDLTLADHIKQLKGAKYALENSLSHDGSNLKFKLFADNAARPSSEAAMYYVKKAEEKQQERKREEANKEVIAIALELVTKELQSAGFKEEHKKK